MRARERGLESFAGTQTGRRARLRRGGRLSLGLALLLPSCLLFSHSSFRSTLPSSHPVRVLLKHRKLIPCNELRSVASPTSTLCKFFLNPIIPDHLHWQSRTLAIFTANSFSPRYSQTRFILPSRVSLGVLSSSRLHLLHFGAAFVDSAFFVSSGSTHRRQPLRPRKDAETTQNSANRYLAPILNE